LEWQLNQVGQTPISLQIQLYATVTGSTSESNYFVQAGSSTSLIVDYPVSTVHQYLSPMEFDFYYVPDISVSTNLVKMVLYPMQGDYVVRGSYISIQYFNGSGMEEVAFPEFTVPYKFNDQLFP
jgi:hypothetical protein